MTEFRPPTITPMLVVGVLFITGLAASGCDNPVTPGLPREVTFDFSSDSHGWTAGFADYVAAQEAFMQLESGHRPVPAPVGPGRAGHFLSGNNQSDDLFMFVKGQVTGLQAGATCRVRFQVEIATDVPADCGGVGGSPGESVFLKAGASNIEPRAVADASGFLRMNVDKGVQSNPGSAALVLGTIEGTPPCGAPRVWELKNFDSANASISARAGADGALWVLVGTDSAFEATTSIYITRVVVRIE